VSDQRELQREANRIIDLQYCSTAAREQGLREISPDDIRALDGLIDRMRDNSA
jgi:hypothetical protein